MAWILETQGSRLMLRRNPKKRVTEKRRPSTEAKKLGAHLRHRLQPLKRRLLLKEASAARPRRSRPSTRTRTRRTEPPSKSSSAPPTAKKKQKQKPKQKPKKKPNKPQHENTNRLRSS